MSNGIVSSVDLNADLNSASVTYDNTSNTFIAEYYETTSDAPVSISLRYSRIGQLIR